MLLSGIQSGDGHFMPIELLDARLKLAGMTEQRSL